MLRPLYALPSTFLPKIICTAILSLILAGANAQIKITYPTERVIYQRDNSNRATIHIGGIFTQPLDKVEARLVPVIQGQGQLVDWTQIQANPKGGTFFGKLVGSGGWYTLEVRGMSNGTQVGRDALSRVGIGEVFIIAGDSNAEGVYNTGATDSKDDRVNCITYSNRETNSLADPTGFAIGRVTANGVIGPRGRGAWFWGDLGDKLAYKLNVPILFMNVAMESTSLQNWTATAQNPNAVVTNPLTTQGYPLGMPYGNIRLAVRYYANTLGLRAVLWQQNEGDVQGNTTATDYQNRLQFLINLVRGEIVGAGGANDYLYVPWLIARTSRMTQWYNPSQSVSPQIIQAQNAIISTIFNKIYPGPELDNVQVPRPDGLHFQENGLTEVARAWDNMLLPQFFASTVPLLPKPPVTFTVRCDANNIHLQLQAPAGYAGYRWQDGNPSPNYTVTGPGTYSVQLRDPLGGTVQTPPLVVTDAIQPPVPTIIPKGEQLVCKDSSLTLSVDALPNYTVNWSDGQVGRVIKVNKTGSYTARLSSPFGCLSQTSASMTVKSLSQKTPIITQSGPYSITAKPDSAIYSSKDVVVKSIVWDWKQATRDLPNKGEFLKVVQNDTYTVRQRVTFESIDGSNRRVCPTVYSAPFVYKLPATDEGVIIYPNPNRSGIVSLETLRDLSNVHITIMSLHGQVVHEQKIPILDNHTVVNLVSLREGVYMFRLTSSGFSQTKKLIIDY